MSIPSYFNLKLSSYKFATNLLVIVLSIFLGISSQTNVANAKADLAVGPIGLAATASPGENCDCSHDRYNCADFASTEDAQACYWACGAQGKGDIHRLDLDDNRVACDSPVVNSNCNCDSDFYSCADFESQEAAQACYWSCGSQNKGDIHKLDPDDDLEACEELPIISPLNILFSTTSASPVLREPKLVMHTIAAGSEANDKCDCSGDFYNCVVFTSQDDAQACYWACGAQGMGDIHGLDLDINMQACEELPAGGDTAETVSEAEPLSPTPIPPPPTPIPPLPTPIPPPPTPIPPPPTPIPPTAIPSQPTPVPPTAVPSPVPVMVEPTAPPAPVEPPAHSGTAGNFDPTAEFQIVRYHVRGFDENNGGIFNNGAQHMIFITVLDENGNGIDGAVVKDVLANDFSIVTGNKGPGKTEFEMFWEPYKLTVASIPSGPVTSQISNQMNTAKPHIPDIIGKMGGADHEYAICPTIDDRCEPPFFHAHWSYEITFQKVN